MKRITGLNRAGLGDSSAMRAILVGKTVVLGLAVVPDCRPRMKPRNPLPDLLLARGA